MFKALHEFQNTEQLCVVLVSFDWLKERLFKMLYKTNEQANVIIHSVDV